MKTPVLALVSALLVILVGCNGSPKPDGSSMPAPSATPAATAAAPVASAPPPVVRPGSHGDHSAKHGGIMVMDANLYHHLEGAYPEAGLFRLYLYDDFTKAIDASGKTGAVRVDGRPEDERIELSYEASTQALVARLQPPPALPVKLRAFINLTNPLTGVTTESRFDFQFKSIGGEAVAAHDHGADGHGHGPGSHEHGSPHGGQVVSAGADHHLELVESPGMLTLWVLDGQENALSVAGMEASLLIQRSGQGAITLPLPAMGSVHFMANSPLEPGEKAVAVATVTMGGITRTGRFTLGSGN